MQNNNGQFAPETALVLEISDNWKTSLAFTNRPKVIHYKKIIFWCQTVVSPNQLSDSVHVHCSWQNQAIFIFLSYFLLIYSLVMRNLAKSVLASWLAAKPNWFINNSDTDSWAAIQCFLYRIYDYHYHDYHAGDYGDEAWSSEFEDIKWHRILSTRPHSIDSPFNWSPIQLVHYWAQQAKHTWSSYYFWR